MAAATATAAEEEARLLQLEEQAEHDGGDAWEYLARRLRTCRPAPVLRIGLALINDLDPKPNHDSECPDLNIFLYPDPKYEPRLGVWDYVRVNVSELPVEELTVFEYLAFKEQLVDEHANSKFMLELDFEPFNASFPRPSMSKSIGNGVQFLNRHLSTNLFQDRESLYPLLNFLKAHNHKGTTMMLNNRIQSLCGLQSARRKADEYLTSIPEDTPSSEFNHRLFLFINYLHHVA
ncbi:hypothetical protein QYE76_032423 [Lolium multiflorum]|uniref:sucrose synthase n=1 Tax=Lolium multiflorum TaxID=4521 RepID=A0AAD8VL55_LOLMU|nr:hypothetical protein QYE76_032423 [Lolium multiflorum]